MAEERPTRLRTSRAPSSEQAEGWIGWRIDDLNGSMLGHVESVIGDGDGCAAWIVIGEFRLGDRRRFLVPAYDAVGGEGRVWSPHERAQVRHSARLLGEAAFNSGADQRLRAHYAAPHHGRRSAA